MRWNAFLEIDPPREGKDLRSRYFGEDLLQIHGKISPILLDLGWYPSGDMKGQYRLIAIRQYVATDEMVASWDQPLKVLSTRSREEIVHAIDEWLWQFTHQVS
jgi:hypothetical protein